jgi:hypothetical protein
MTKYDVKVLMKHLVLTKEINEMQDCLGDYMLLGVENERLC